MLIRYAEFTGQIHHGKQQEFFDLVATVLVPLWTKFDGAVRVTVCREIERDDGAPQTPLILAITYSDKPALARAMACDARFQSREETRRLLAMFDGTVWHRVTEAEEYQLEPSQE